MRKVASVAGFSSLIVALLGFSAWPIIPATMLTITFIQALKG